MTIKSESLCPDELTKEKLFIERSKVYEVFSELEQKIVILWQWNFNRLSKLRFICLEGLFREIFFLEEHKQFDNLIQISSEVFLRVSWKNWDSGRKKSAKLSKLLFMLPAGLFQEKCFLPEKKSDTKTFSQCEQWFMFFFGKISAYSSKVRPWVQMNSLRKKACFLEQKLFNFFSDVERKIVEVWQKNPKASSKLLFQFSRGTFSLEKVFLKKKNSLVFTCRKAATFFRNVGKKSRD